VVLETVCGYLCLQLFAVFLLGILPILVPLEDAPSALPEKAGIPKTKERKIDISYRI
jgi:hypothetical protein